LVPAGSATAITPVIPLRLDLRPGWTNPAARTLQARETASPHPGSKPMLHYERLDLRFSGNASGVDAIFDGSEGAFEAIVQLTLQVVLRPLGGLLLHASAGIWHGGAWLMPGKSGTGKSTAARNGGFQQVLADEMVVVRRAAAGGFDVWGTPFWSPDRPLPLHAGSAPLHTLARLVQAKAPHAGPLSAAAASAWLLESVVLYETSGDARASAFGLACDIAQAARCIRLAFPKEGPWLYKLSVDF
jgi:hypothetical protein